MLNVYTSTTTSFSNLGLGVLKDFISDPLITEELNGAYNLEFDYAKNGWLSEHLVEGNIIKANGQPFRIWNIKKDMKKITILAKHIFFDLSVNFLEDVAPTEQNSQSALGWILERTKTNNLFSVSGDCSELFSARYVRKNVIDAIYNEENAILKRFGGEIELNGYNVFIHNKRGNNKGYSIRYGKNLSGIEFNLDFSSVITKIMPQGKDELLIDELYVTSDKVNNYFTPFYKKVEFNDIGVDENTTEEQAKEKLIQSANKMFDDGVDIPKVSIKIDFIELSKCIEYSKYANLETCNLGDTVSAIIPQLGIDMDIRIVKTVYNCLLKRITNLELGTAMPNIATETNRAINQVDKINPNSILQEAKDNATKLINHPFNGNVYIDENTGVIYLMDTADPNTATNVWKWSLGGLGFSSSGINGTYETAITQDGSIVADFITAGKLNTNLIEGFDELIMRVESHEEQITDVDIKVNNNNQDILNKLNDYAKKENVTSIEKSVTQLQTDSKYSITAIENIRQNGVSKVDTATGMTFDINGLGIDKTGAPTASKIDEAGMEIVNKNNNNATQFYSGYVDNDIATKNDVLHDYEGQTITYTENLYFKQYCATQNGRIENVYDENHGKGIGFFI